MLLLDIILYSHSGDIKNIQSYLLSEISLLNNITKL